MFFATNSDNLLVNELHLRIKYALYASTILLNIALIYFSCITLRKDIDDRKFHTVATAPVHRAQIWLGKFLGVLTLALTVFISISLAIALSCTVFILNWENQTEVNDLKTNFFRTYYACTPDLTSLKKEVKEKYKKELQKLIAKQEEEEKTGTHVHDEHCHHDHDHEGEGEEWRARKYLLIEVRKDQQIIPPNTERRWTFHLDNSAIHGDTVLLRFKLYANQRRNIVTGVWKIAGEDGWKHEFSGYPFLTHEIKIPADIVKRHKTLELIYKQTGTAYVIFPIFKNGLTLLYDSGSIWKNYLFLLFFSLAHMASLIAVSLMFSSLFSYAVAIFITTATYIIGAFSTFFQNILTDLSFHDTTLLNTILAKIIELGMWITGGTKALPVNDMFSDGISIPVISLLHKEGVSLIIFLIAVCLIGIFALTKKEIDKILQK